MPWTIVGAMNAHRKSWFEEVGVTNLPKWDAYYDAGKKLKAKGHPFGQAVSHSFGDPPTFVYPLLWSYGGKEVEADGKTVAINSKNTINSVKFMTGFYKDTCDEGGLAWDDTSNNRAFLSQHLVHAQWRVDLHRVAAQSGQVHYREGCTVEDRYPARASAQRTIRAVRSAFVLLAHADELLEERPGEGPAEVGPYSRKLREVVHIAEGLRHAANGAVGMPRAVERGPGNGPLQGRGQAGQAPGYAGPAARKPPRP